MPEGMSHKEYQQFLIEVESALYYTGTVANIFDPDPVHSWEDEDKGVVYIRYKGWKSKTYCQPIFDLKSDHKSRSEESGTCLRCPDADIPYSRWNHLDDEISSVQYVWGFTKTGHPVMRPIHFIPFFAARWSHP